MPPGVIGLSHPHRKRLPPGHDILTRPAYEWHTVAAKRE